MGRGFSRLVHGAVATGALGLSACGDPAPCDPPDDELPDAPEDPGSGPGAAPVLLAAEALAETTLELRFSDALGSVEAVEPQSFRISLATTRTAGAYYGCPFLTTYQDLSTGTPAAVTSVWNVPDDAELLRLSLALPITPAHCNTIDNARASGNAAGLFLHYAAGDGAYVQDLDGEPLDDIAAPWVLAATGVGDCASYYGTSCTLPGLFPNLLSYLPIPCPRP